MSAGAVRPGADERGFSLAEVMVAISLLAIVAVVIGSTLTSSFQATKALENESRAMAELRIALSRIEREFRSAECIEHPVVGVSGGTTASTSVRFTTRVGSGLTTVTYAVAEGALTRAVGESEGVELVATGLLTTPVPFAVTETPRRSLEVVFTVPSSGDGSRVVQSTIAGRNAWRSC